MPKKEKKTLMTNDDPKPTIIALCEIKDPIITYNTYKKKYEELFRSGKQISRGHADAHFFFLRQLGLLTEIKKTEYKISATGTYICELLRKGKEREYKQALTTDLLTTENKEFFEEFLEFVKRNKSLHQIKEKFGKTLVKGKEKEVETYRTLIAWCEEANLIRKVESEHGTYVAVAREPSKKYTLEEFWQELLLTYKEMQKSSPLGSKLIYVPIGELRLRVSCQLGFQDTAEFDQYLSQLLSSKQYRLYIRLHGAPTHAYEYMESFTYNKKKYPLLSMMV